MRSRPRPLPTAMGLVCLVACTPPPSMDHSAESYVKLVLALGQHDPDYVDAYYGPSQWRADAAAESLSVETIRARADGLGRDLDRVPDPTDPMVVLRLRYLRKQVASLRARAAMLLGDVMTFDEESMVLYDAVAPANRFASFDATIAQLDQRLPGTGAVQPRYTRYRDRFVIPADRLDAVFRRAIDECRDRTTRFLELPAGERFAIEYVTGKSWSGYNWYQGNAASLIQVNTDLPVYIDRAVDLACHEGYPGHHVYNLMLERHLAIDRGWVEFSVYPLFSPQSLIAEGSANYGIEMAFPGAERVTFERDVLFPLAGLDPAGAESYYAIQDLVGRLSYAGNEVARNLLEGEISEEQAASWLERYALMSPERARQRVRFIQQYRAYVINYNLGKDLVARYVEREAGDDVAARWRVFGALLGSPRLPSGLR